MRLTQRLTDSPACLVGDEHGMSRHLERILRESGQSVPASRPVLEINPDHPVVQRLRQESDSALFADWSHILFDQALLAEGGELEDPATFVKRLNSLDARARWRRSVEDLDSGQLNASRSVVPVTAGRHGPPSFRGSGREVLPGKCDHYLSSRTSTSFGGSRCALVNSAKKHRDIGSLSRSIIMSASHHPTDIHKRQRRKEKRDKLRARIAAAPTTGRATLEAKLQRTYSAFHRKTDEKASPAG